MLLIFTFFDFFFAQDYEAILNSLKLKSDTSLASRKCATALISELVVSKKRTKENTEILNRPNLSESVISTDGHFRVHYDQSGSNYPNYNLDDLLVALDTVYKTEILDMGFPFPPNDNGEGGDNLYDIYIVNLGSSYYGYTIPEEILENNKWTSFVTINSDYTGFPTEGINAAKVTVAHEFHHAIQIGNYINRYDIDGFYYEITSTAMEERVFPQVNDFWAYLPDYMNNTGRTFPNNNGYNLAIWNIYLNENYGDDIIKRIWEFMPNQRALNAINSALVEKEKSFNQELYEFGEWTFFTGYRAKQNQYFDDSKNMAMLKPVGFASPQENYNIYSQPLSNTFLYSLVERVGITDTVISQFTNLDLANAIDPPYTTTNFNYVVYNSNIGDYEIINNISYDFQSANDNNFSGKIYVNNDLAENYSIASEEFVYPQPFLSSSDFIYFPIPSTTENEIQLKILDLTMTPIFANFVAIDITKKKARWNGVLSSGKKINSGIYFFVTLEGENIKTGKFAVINE